MKTNLKSEPSNYNKYPSIDIDGDMVKGWDNIIQKFIDEYCGSCLIAIDCYVGVDVDALKSVFEEKFTVVKTTDFFKSAETVEAFTRPDVTYDAVFGYITRLKISDFFDSNRIKTAHNVLASETGTVIVIGPGALEIVPHADLKIYADLARWEIQTRMKANRIDGLGVINRHEPFNQQYKRGFFVDWRVCDKHKKEWFLKCDFLLDTKNTDDPKLVDMNSVKEGFRQTVTQPFSVVPFFDPGPWGGHWMEKVCNLDASEVPNHAWCFNCIPEENSLLFRIHDDFVELPAIDLVFFESKALLGDAVEARFGKEFPIRFDFLDTMQGGNLSLQVHPDTTYIQENFGMHYTQDESYYLLDADDDGVVYLGFKENADVDEMFETLKLAEKKGGFDAEKYVNKFQAKQHDHFLIPGGTIHCSGKNSMVLEISSTPYIFTFKMWDWGRVGLDGKPRPINIEHAAKVIDRKRDTQYAINELINKIEVIEQGDGWVEEKTGLHPREFIETRRHWFSKPVKHFANGSVNVMMLVEGSEAIVESPHNLFPPFVVHYAEAFIIPAAIDVFCVSPPGDAEGKTLATIKAYVRV
jgi:mannose-6-phosphate isomerase class I